MAYFRCGGGEKHYATISVSTDYLFGETVTCTCADVEYSRTATFSDDGDASFTVNDWGTYTLTADSRTVTVVVSAWYVTYEVEFAGSVTLTLTLEGAMNDTITIKNSEGSIVGTCIFNNSCTGQTSITIPINGGQYTFVSSVAKSLNGSGADYEKNITITRSTARVCVYPTLTDDQKLCLYWCGNECVDVTGGWGGYFTNAEYYTSGNYPLDLNTNSMGKNAAYTNRQIYSRVTNNIINVSEFDNLYAIGSCASIDQYATGSVRLSTSNSKESYIDVNWGSNNYFGPGAKNGDHVMVVQPILYAKIQSTEVYGICQASSSSVGTRSMNMQFEQMWLTKRVD